MYWEYVSILFLQYAKYIYHVLNVNVRFPVLWLSIVARGRKNQSPESRLICMMSPWHDAFRAGRRKGKLNSILKMTPLATNWEVFEIRLLLQSYLVTAVQSLAAVAHFLRNVSSSWCEQINLSNHLKMKIRWIILKKKNQNPAPFCFLSHSLWCLSSHKGRVEFSWAYKHQSKRQGK